MDQGWHAVFTVGVLTTSDTAAKGEREDASGQAIVEMATAAGFSVEIQEVVPDDHAIIADLLRLWSQNVDLILTTGGTGFGPRDVTPEATLEVLERQAPGLSEYMRAGTAEKTTLSYLSRGVAGTRGNCLIVNLPGSPRGVRECLEVVLPLIPHALDTMQGPTQVHPPDQGEPWIKAENEASSICTSRCPCWGMPTDGPRICPLCDQVFGGSGWDGIDGHYKSKHEKLTEESYASWFGRMCPSHRPKK